MRYAKRTRDIYRIYIEYNTEELWNELLAADRYIIDYLFGGIYRRDSTDSGIETNKEALFFKALEDSIVLIRLLKRKPGHEIYDIYSYLKNRCYEEDSQGRTDIQSHLGFIEKELFE